MEEDTFSVQEILAERSASRERPRQWLVQWEGYQVHEYVSHHFLHTVLTL